MDRQEIFEKIVAAMNKQGRRAIGPNGCCTYRSEYGLNVCAIGCLLPAALIPPGIDGTIAEVLFQHPSWAEFLGVETGGDIAFLTAAQRTLHDRFGSWTDARGRCGRLTEHAVRGFAADWGLSLPSEYT